ncbi:MAG: type II toxin-antitoxin system HicA family toxin [Planctomycetia bacterium]|nr:type II toxin-antitoxin system HicA family toxin [Planctomycetia bacterium]
MNRRDLERHLRANGCELLRHGSKHDVWWNPSNGRRSTVPRHAVIKPGTVRSICNQLEVPPP